MNGTAYITPLVYNNSRDYTSCREFSAVVPPCGGTRSTCLFANKQPPLLDTRTSFYFGHPEDESVPLDSSSEYNQFNKLHRRTLGGWSDRESCRDSSLGLCRANDMSDVLVPDTGGRFVTSFYSDSSCVADFLPPGVASIMTSSDMSGIPTSSAQCLMTSRIENEKPDVKKKPLPFPWMKTTKSHAHQWKAHWPGKNT